MSRGWRPFVGRFASPFSTSASGPPIVTSDDYDYMTNEDINARPRPLSGDDERYDHGSQNSRMERYTTFENPDMLYIKQKNRMVTVEFPAYTIAEGLLTVEMIRQAAADRLGIKDVRRCKLQYKGKTLRDDKQTAQAAGLKQHSELTCVITEGDYGDSDSEDAYDHQQHRRTTPSRPTTRTNRDPLDYDVSSSNPATPSRPTFPTTAPTPAISESLRVSPVSGAAAGGGGGGGGGGTGAAAAAAAAAVGQKLEIYRPPLDSTPPRDKIQHALQFFRSTYLPICTAFLNHPPQDPAVRKKEATRLGETVFGQILNRLDEVQTDGYEAIRSARKSAINEVKTVIGELDELKDGR